MVRKFQLVGVVLYEERCAEMEREVGVIDDERGLGSRSKYGGVV